MLLQTIVLNKPLCYGYRAVREKSIRFSEINVQINFVEFAF